MNAGEAVFQGREGTGLAQILNWKDYRPAPQQRGIDPLQLQRLRMQQKSADDKKIEESMNFENGDPLFNPTLQRDELALRKQREEIYATSQNSDLAIRQTKELENNIRANAKRSKAVREIYNLKQNQAKQNPNINSKRYGEYLNDYLMGDVDENGFRVFSTINEKKAEEVDFHPSVKDPKKMVILDAKSNLGKLQDQKFLPEELDGNHQNFYVKEGATWRFKTGEDGKIAPEIINEYQSNEEIYDGYLWNIIAKEKGFGENDRITREDREAIDAEFDKEQLNPKRAIQVRGEIETVLNLLQSKATVLSTTSKGRDFNENGYGKAPVPKLQISDARTIKKAQSLSDIDIDGDLKDVMDAEGSAVDLQGVGEKYKSFKERFTFDDGDGNPATGVLLALGPNKKGQKTLFLREDKAFNDYSVREVPFNSVIKNKLLELVDKEDAQTINQWAASKNKTSVLDRERLETTAKTIIDGVINGVDIGNGKSKDDKKIAENLKTYLEAIPGLKDKIKSVEVYHSGTLNPYNNKATINGVEFDLDKDGKEKIKDYLLNLDRDTFRKSDQPSQAQEKNPTQKTPEQNSSGPQKGKVEDGYEFLGGDPADSKNWKKVN